MMLFDEFAVRRARGERPDVGEYLERAGEGADELRELLDRLLASTPPPEPDPDAVAAMQAWLAGEPPLLELRVRRGLRRDDVVGSLVTRLGLDPAKREKVKRYYHRLENGLLDPSRVDRRVLDALSETLRARVEDLGVWRTPPLDAAMHYVRADAEQAAPVFEPRAAAEADEERDEVDELFTGGGDR